MHLLVLITSIFHRSLLGSIISSLRLDSDTRIHSFLSSITPNWGVNDTAPADGVQPIVTDGTHLRSLYLDAFYIPDATLAFLNGIKLYLFVLSRPLTTGRAQLTLGCSHLPMANSCHWLSPRYGQRRPTSHPFPSYGGAIIISMLSAEAMGATSSSWALSRHAVSSFPHALSICCAA